MNIILFNKNDITKDSMVFNIPINDERAQHILHILHKKQGDTFDAGIENGKAGKAQILLIDNQKITCSFAPESNGKLLYPLEMIMGFPRPIQLRRIFRDMASVGICRIHLCGTELGEKSYLQSKIIEHDTAKNLLKNGTIQAKSTHIPQLHTYPSVQNCLEQLHLLQSKEPTNKTIRIVLDNIKPTTKLSVCAQSKTHKIHKKALLDITAYAAIGSERGWSDAERELFNKASFCFCSMGERILRTETAATVAASIILENIFNII
ncbi:MAG TPA: RsmE family RNA methyltransferase [Treponemataceae bacterium]|nr:RsmE family RNA methyltransferase [Treponemataceae bacterium]